MTENEFSKEEYEAKIAELQKQLKEAQQDNTLDEIKNKYQKVIEDKDKEIQELNKTLEANKKKVDSTVDDLNREVEEKLRQSEEYQKLLKTVEELEKDKAEATVDKYIQEGKLLPVQKDTALEFAISQPDKFIDLYENAPSIVDTSQKPKSKKLTGTDKMVDYFKK